jgi:hypothetical protein
MTHSGIIRERRVYLRCRSLTFFSPTIRGKLQQTHPYTPKHLLTPFQCTGSTLTSEDSSEVAFLLVENYQLTASVGLRIGREFLATTSYLFISPFGSSLRVLESGEETCLSVVIRSYVMPSMASARVVMATVARCERATGQ